LSDDRPLMMTNDDKQRSAGKVQKDNLTELASYILAELGDKVMSHDMAFDEFTIQIAPENLISCVRFLRDDSQTRFISFIDICGVDYPEREERFESVYHFLSPNLNARIRIKVAVGEDVAIPSLTGLFPGANWFERESYDMYGILFSGHPDLRRLLTDYGFDGHPQRKDFPLTGYVEVRYNDEQKRVVYEPVQLRQEFRNFDFLSPWEGTDYVLPNENKGDEKASG